MRPLTNLNLKTVARGSPRLVPEGLPRLQRTNTPGAPVAVLPRRQAAGKRLAA